MIVAPGQPYAIPLRPEFITPQDGHNPALRGEIAAGKRWLEKNGDFYQNGNPTLLDDDIYAHQPFCKKTLLYGYHFIFVCKPDSHKYLYEWVELLEPRKDRHQVTVRVRTKNKWETHIYRYANSVPLVAADDALNVNWCEVTVIDENGEQLYKNSFITDFKITNENVSGIVISGRARWKIENENNNTLKTKGYNLEHNFGHGKQHLASLLAAMNILAFLFHAYLSFCDESYRLIRAHLPTRKTFFEDVRALTRYICFPSWEKMMDFMMRGLEIGPYLNSG